MSNNVVEEFSGRAKFHDQKQLTLRFNNLKSDSEKNEEYLV